GKGYAGGNAATTYCSSVGGTGDSLLPGIANHATANGSGGGADGYTGSGCGGATSGSGGGNAGAGQNANVAYGSVGGNGGYGDTSLGTIFFGGGGGGTNYPTTTSSGNATGYGAPGGGIALIFAKSIQGGTVDARGDYYDSGKP